MDNKDKLVKNEKLIRDWNQGAARAIKNYYDHEKDMDNEDLEFVCECSDMRCPRTICMSIKDYERIHKRKNRFVLAHGHEIPAIERTASKRKKFQIVVKPQLTE